MGSRVVGSGLIMRNFNFAEEFWVEDEAARFSRELLQGPVKSKAGSEGLRLQLRRLWASICTSSSSMSSSWGRNGSEEGLGLYVKFLRKKWIRGRFRPLCQVLEEEMDQRKV